MLIPLINWNSNYRILTFFFQLIYFSIKSTYKSYRHILVLFVKGWKYILLWGHNNVWSWGCTQSIFHLLPFQIGQKTIHHRVWALFAHGQWSISTIVAMMQQKWRVGLAFFTLCSGHFHKKLVQTKTKLSLLLPMLKVHIKYNTNLKLGHWEKRKKHGLMRRGRRIHKIPMVELELPPTICGQKLNKNDGGKEIERPHRNRIWIFFRHLVYLCPQNWSHRRLGSGGWRHP